MFIPLLNKNLKAKAMINKKKSTSELENKSHGYNEPVASHEPILEGIGLLVRTQIHL